MLETKVITTKFGYMGLVAAWEDNRKLWTIKTGMTRLTKPDAMADAIILKNDIESQNSEFTI